MIPNKKLDSWIARKRNVLLVGERGVGKSSIIMDAFKRNGLKYLYFSASTLDPWVDLVGVPKEIIGDDGKPYLDLVRPKALACDGIQAMFFDELNRAPKKIRNAVMELIQFKSINGRPFPSLQMVWGAINPETEKDGEMEYDVERLDPAQKDRFHVIYDVPYKIDKSFFTTKYGDVIGVAACDWWNELTKEEKLIVSPRRLEYAIEEYIGKGDLKDVLGSKLNVQKLIEELACGSYTQRLKALFDKKDSTETKAAFSDENFVNSVIGKIADFEQMSGYFLPYLSAEKLTAYMSSNKKVLSYVKRNIGSFVPQMEQLGTGMPKDIRSEWEVYKRTSRIGVKSGGSLSSETFISNTTAKTVVNWKKIPVCNNYSIQVGITSMTSTQIAQIITNSPQTTERIQYYCAWIHNILKGAKLTVEKIAGTIEIIDALSSRSHVSTLAQYYVEDVYNWCKEILSSNGVTVSPAATTATKLVKIEKAHENTPF